LAWFFIGYGPAPLRASARALVAAPFTSGSIGDRVRSVVSGSVRLGGPSGDGLRRTWSCARACSGGLWQRGGPDNKSRCQLMLRSTGRRGWPRSWRRSTARTSPR